MRTYSAYSACFQNPKPAVDSSPSFYVSLHFFIKNNVLLMQWRCYVICGQRIVSNLLPAGIYPAAMLGNRYEFKKAGM